MLWSQIIYGHRTASISPKIVRFCGARTAPGRRQEESCDFWTFLDIVRYPVKFRYYLKFHGARTAFGRFIEGKLRPGTVRCPDGARAAFIHIGQAPDHFCLKHLSYDSNGARPGTVLCPARTPYDVWQAPRTLKNLLTNRPMPVRAQADVLWVELPPARSDVFCRSTYYIYIDISLLKTKIINTKKKKFRLSNWGWLTCNEQELLKFLQSWASVVFITITVRVSLNLFYCNNLFLWRNDGTFLYKWIYHCTWKFA